MSNSSNKTKLKTCQEDLQRCKNKNKEETNRVFKITLDFIFAQREYARYTRNVIIKMYNKELKSSLSTVNAEKFMAEKFDRERMEWAFSECKIEYSYLKDILAAVRYGDRIAHKFDHVRDFKDLETLEKGMNNVLISNDRKESFKRIAELWRTTISKLVAIQKAKEEKEKEKKASKNKLEKEQRSKEEEKQKKKIDKSSKKKVSKHIKNALK